MQRFKKKQVKWLAFLAVDLSLIKIIGNYMNWLVLLFCLILPSLSNECKLGSYLNDEGTCVECPVTCSACEGKIYNNENCSGCLPGQKLLDGKCQGCQTGMKQCTDSVSCFSQYLPQYNNDVIQQCFPDCGISNCIQCSDFERCEICQDGYNNEGNRCEVDGGEIGQSNDTNTSKCQVGYFLKQEKCIGCSKECLSCENENSFCVECAQNYEKHGWKCINKNNIPFEIKLVSGADQFKNKYADVRANITNLLEQKQDKYLTVSSISAQNSIVTLVGTIDDYNNFTQKILLNNLEKQLNQDNFQISGMKVINCHFAGEPCCSCGDYCGQNCCDSCQTEQEGISIGIIVLIIVAGAVLIGVIAVVFYCWPRKNLQNLQKQNNGAMVDGSPGTLKDFNLKKEQYIPSHVNPSRMRASTLKPNIAWKLKTNNSPDADQIL